MINEKLLLLPTSPGVYQMLDKSGNIIYIGKAKNLNNRVRSYFVAEKFGKTKALVDNIFDFKYIITTTEQEALILENNLIKKYNPKYNILLKDDKTYPYIEVTSEKFFRVKVIRQITKSNRNHNNLFGPFPNVYEARKMVEVINRLYKVRKCEVLPKKECLYYHIDQCLGYCINDIPESVIEQMRGDILSFLRGNVRDIKEKIINEISLAADKTNYEAAKELKLCLDFITTSYDNQKMEFSHNESFDGFNYYEENGYLSIQTLLVRNGKLIQSVNEIIHLIEDVNTELVRYVSSFYENKKILLPKLILIPFMEDSQLLSTVLNVKVINPQRGIKKEFLDLAYKNAEVGLKDKIELIKNDNSKTLEANEALGKLLNIDNLQRIEAFDNSNLFGTFAVSGMVVFEHGLPAKKEYRKYKITTVNKPDDYEMMREVIYRRYYRVLMEGLSLPDLIVIDGGIGQVTAAQTILNELNVNCRLIGLKKNDSHQTEAIIDGKTLAIIDIPKRSHIFYLLARIQTEVHNYTINFHKQLRSKGALNSILDGVPGLGQKRRELLLSKYKTIVKINEASLEELSELIPLNVAVSLKDIIKTYKNQ